MNIGDVRDPLKLRTPEQVFLYRETLATKLERVVSDEDWTVELMRALILSAEPVVWRARPFEVGFEVAAGWCFNGYIISPEDTRLFPLAQIWLFDEKALSGTTLRMGSKTGGVKDELDRLVVAMILAHFWWGGEPRGHDGFKVYFICSTKRADGYRLEAVVGPSIIRDTVLDIADPVELESYSMVLGLSGFMKQKRACKIHRLGGSRADRRRAKRLGEEVREFDVVTLREVEPAPRSNGDSGRRLKYRHWRSHHIRTKQHYGPGNQYTKSIFIPATVCGPADAPFKTPKPKMRNFSRL